MKLKKMIIFVSIRKKIKKDLTCIIIID